MREDMDKVIVERPRKGGGKHAMRSDRRRTRRDPDASPRSRGMKRLHGSWWEQKRLNENLTPLYRYLNKQAGRPWDKVFSEICERINVNSAVQLHIRQHIDDVVATRVQMIGKIPYARLPGNSGTPIQWTGGGRYRRMYVDPATGILRLSPLSAPRWKRREKSDPTLLPHPSDPTIFFRKVEGIWYALELRAATEAEAESGNFSLTIDRRPMVVTRRRQLNTREIRKLPIPSSVRTAPGKRGNSR